MIGCNPDREELSLMSDDDRIAYLAGDVVASLDSAERAELDDLRNLLADPSMWAEPDPSLQQRVVDGITAAAVAPETAPPAVAEVTDLAQRRSKRLRYAILAAAAAVLLAVGITLAVNLGGSTSQPQQFAAALTATPLAPDAKGQATLTKTLGGWRIQINATGLPRRDNGAYYEAWLKNAAGVLVPIGTFNQPKDVTLWAGVPPSEFPTLTITRQRVGGGEDSSGKVVLVGSTKRVH
jgi:hypothetical protein